MILVTLDENDNYVDNFVDAIRYDSLSKYLIKESKRYNSYEEFECCNKTHKMLIKIHSSKDWGRGQIENGLMYIKGDYTTSQLLNEPNLILKDFKYSLLLTDCIIFGLLYIFKEDTEREKFLKLLPEVKIFA